MTGAPECRPTPVNSRGAETVCSKCAGCTNQQLQTGEAMRISRLDGNREMHVWYFGHTLGQIGTDSPAMDGDLDCYVIDFDTFVD